MYSWSAGRRRIDSANAFVSRHSFRTAFSIAGMSTPGSTLVKAAFMALVLLLFEGMGAGNGRGTAR
jgi:hypothetical protein